MVDEYSPYGDVLRMTKVNAADWKADRSKCFTYECNLFSSYQGNKYLADCLKSDFLHGQKVAEIRVSRKVCRKWY